MSKQMVAASVVLIGFVLLGYAACQTKNAPETTLTGVGDIVCRPGERAITLVNNCQATTLYVGAAGNAAGTKTCQSDADCPGSSCDLGGSPHVCRASVSCSQHSDCPGVNQFCNGATPTQGLPYCQTTSDCNVEQEQYCNKSAGVPGYMGAKGSCQTDTDCPTNTVCDTSKQGQNRCAFYYCVSNQCYFAPVPLDSPIPSNATPCNQPSDCTNPNQFCYAPQGVTGFCVDVPQNGNSWTLSPGGTKTQICVPTPWAGRFWPRTNCAMQEGSYQCDVGTCLGQSGEFSQNCAQSGINSPTVAEVFFPVFDGISNDFYDVSLVDGGNIGIQVAPDSATYNLLTSNGIDSADCPAAPDSCEKRHGSASWVCDAALNKCVNQFQCASPGCVSGCEQYGYGQYQGADRNCKWSNDLAIAQSDCPAELQSMVNSVYVGCKSPKDACASNPASAALQCSTYNDLYGCTNTYKASCYSSSDPNCCGCPSWEKDSCEGDNTTWHTQAEQSYYSVFHSACPTAYSFPYDDKNSTFTCVGKSADVNVNYVVTFCPR